MKVMRIRRRFGWLIVSSLALLLAGTGCSDDDGETGDTTTTTTSTGGSGQGGNSGAGGSGDGGSVGDLQLMDIFPLELGATWAFEVVSNGSGGICGPGMYTSLVESEQEVGGMDAFLLTGWCSGGSPDAAPFAWDETTGDLLAYFNSEWRLNLANDLTDGVMFTAFDLNYQWTDEGSMTVPAGTFDNCWTLRQVGAVRRSTYCLGVGPVRHFYDDGVGNGYEALLTNFD